MKLFVSILFLALNLNLYSQYTRDNKVHYRFFINGKALAGPISTENKYGKSFTIGAGVYFF